MYLRCTYTDMNKLKMFVNFSLCSANTRVSHLLCQHTYIYPICTINRLLHMFSDRSIYVDTYDVQFSESINNSVLQPYQANTRIVQSNKWNERSWAYVSINKTCNNIAQSSQGSNTLLMIHYISIYLSCVCHICDALLKW